MSSLNAVATNIMPKALEQLLSEKIAAQNVEVAESFKPVLSYIASLASNSCVAEEFDPVSLRSPVRTHAPHAPTCRSTARPHAGSTSTSGRRRARPTSSPS